MAGKRHFLFLNEQNQLETRSGYVYDKTITTEGLQEHYRTLLMDMEYIAKEYNKLFPATSLALYVLISCIREGSIDELAPYLDGFLQEKAARVQDGEWPYGKHK